MARLSTDGTKILDNYDRFTGTPFNATKVSVWYDGTPMNDSKVDNVIYFKNTITLGGGYSKRDYEGGIDVKWFGAKGDGIIDDTIAVQKAIDFSSSAREVLHISAGNYLINVESISSGGLVFKNNSHIICSKETIFSQKPTTKIASSLFSIRNISNVTIQGGNLIGDRNFVGVPAPDNHGIFIAQNADNITIIDVNIDNFRGDGIVVAAFSLSDDASSNILIENVDCNNNGRQGLSIISAKNMRVLNSTFRNTNGSSPQAGVDIEPNAGNFVRDVIIDNCYFIGNKGQGLVITGNNITSRIENIVVTNCVCTNNKSDGVLVGGRPLIKGIFLDNIKIIQDSTCTGTGLTVAESTNVSIRNVSISKDGTGAGHINITRTTNLILDNIYSRANMAIPGYGLGLSFSCTNISIINCDIVSRGDTITFIEQSGETRNNITISNNILSSSLGRAVSLNNVNGLYFNNNNIVGSAYDGINLVNCSNVKILENTISNAGSIRINIDRGIYLNNVSDSVIKQNKVRATLTGDNRIKCALELDVNSKRNIISDNNFTDLYPASTIVNLSNYKNIIDDSSILKVGSTNQRPSITNNTIPVGYTYYDETIKSLIMVKGAYETASITINNSALASGNIGITLNNIVYNIPVIAGDTNIIISDKIARSNYDGWSTVKSGFTITFIKDTADICTDTTTNSNSTGVVLSTLQLVKGATRFYDQISINTLVNTTSTNFTKTSLNSEYPSATLGTVVVQDSLGKTYIKKDNSSTGNWSVFSTAQLT